jgi:chromosome segregation ATPase
MTNEQTRLVHTEGSPWFWKIFGGAIMGLVSILLLAHITNINSNVDRTFLDLRGDNKELNRSVEELRHKITTCESSNSALKEEVKILRDWNKETSRQVQELREKLAAELGKRKQENP